MSASQTAAAPGDYLARLQDPDAEVRRIAVMELPYCDEDDIVPLLLAFALRPNDVSLSIGVTFALAASTFCPVLILGIWWRRLTWPGAAAGMIVGGGLVIAAIGVDDDEFGTRLRAFVVLVDGATATEDDLREHVRAHLARYKVPRDVVLLDELPRNATGKILKRELVEHED